MKVTLDGIKAKIKGETYLVLPDGRSTLCILTMQNDYTIMDLSPAEFGRLIHADTERYTRYIRELKLKPE